MKEILRERKELIKMQDPYPSSSSSSFLDHYYNAMSNYSTLTELLNFSVENTEKSSSLGFMELLNMHDFGPSSSLFDVFQASDDHRRNPKLHQDQYSSAQGYFNAPATPNSSTISSESSGGQINDEQTKELGVLDGDGEEDHSEDEDEDEEEENQRTKIKLLKPKKTSQKRQREQRFAFMTKSEVDHLEDGYRWRKYGQKAVKNSPFPRSYYRCTSSSCNVKKRVERSCNDPSTVVTTYEGKHTHPSPAATPRAPPYSGFSSFAQAPVLTSHHHELLYNFNSPVFHVGPANTNSTVVSPHHAEYSFSGLLVDNGLLQDIVPWSVIKKEEQGHVENVCR